MSDTYQTGAADQLAKIDATLQLILAALQQANAKPVVKTTQKQRDYMKAYQRRKRAEAKAARIVAVSGSNGQAIDQAISAVTEVHEPGLTA